MTIAIVLFLLGLTVWGLIVGPQDLGRVGFGRQARHERNRLARIGERRTHVLVWIIRRKARTE